MVLQTHKLLVCWWPDWKGLAESSTLASVTSRLVFSLWPCKTPLEIFLAYLHVGLDYWNSPSHGTLIAWSPNSIRWVHRCQDFALSTIALWRKPLRNVELRILPKLWPWLPFSSARKISDRNIWMFSPLQFHFQFMSGYELKTVFCSSRNCQRISCNSHRLQKRCE